MNKYDKNYNININNLGEAHSKTKKKTSFDNVQN